VSSVFMLLLAAENTEKKPFRLATKSRLSVTARRSRNSKFNIPNSKENRRKTATFHELVLQRPQSSQRNLITPPYHTLFEAARNGTFEPRRLKNGRPDGKARDCQPRRAGAALQMLEFRFASFNFDSLAGGIHACSPIPRARRN
jgi:hypothetical protein